MKNLNEALDDLKSEIVENGYSEAIVSEIASSYELNAVLLLRKFEEQTGKRPEEYKVTDLTKKMESAALKSAWREFDKITHEANRPLDIGLFGVELVFGEDQGIVIALLEKTIYYWNVNKMQRYALELNNLSEAESFRKSYSRPVKLGS